MHNLKDRNVLILGLGVSGLAMARWCARCGAALTVVDTRAQPPQLAALLQAVPGATFLQAALSEELIKGSTFHAVFKSPGIAPKESRAVIAAAAAKGIPVGGELTLFAQGLEALKTSQQYCPKVVAVTGTNGKTTVTALTGHLVDWAGQTVQVAGNIGPSLLDTLAQAMDGDTLPAVWVLELSSFQLDIATDFEPTAATVLNVTQDHLDWHDSMEAYAQSKGRIFGKQGLKILNRNDPVVMAMAPVNIKGKPVRPWITFGLDLPQRPGDFGIEEVNGMVWLVRALEADETRKKRRDEEQELHIQRLMPADVLRIRGRHNATNALAALALCAAAGCGLAPLLFGLREYRGEPHRVESIGILNSVEFFDDSKGTNVGATVAALNGLGPERKLVVILGGEGKGQDFAPLVPPVARYARAVVVIGRDAAVITDALSACDVPLLQAATMDEAVTLANQRAHAGDAVLLSPACASFDMFKDYNHRAEVFCAAVHDLATAAGVSLEAQT